MKKPFYFLALMLFPLVLNSCTGDDPEEDETGNVSTKEIIGTWKATQIDEDGDVGKFEITFKKDATFVHKYDWGEGERDVIDGTYRYDRESKVLYLWDTWENPMGSIDCTIKGSTMTWGMYDDEYDEYYTLTWKKK